MGRVRLGMQGRTVTGTVKITGEERLWLERRYGSVSRGLRAGLAILAATDPPAVTAPEAPERCRVHRSWDVVGERGEQGVMYVVRRCRDCGAMSERRK